MSQPASSSYLRSGRWVPVAVFAVVMAIGCVFLARWQWSRLDDRRQANASIVANESAVQVPPAELAAPGSTVSADAVQWRSVTARGEYLPDTELLVRKRSFNGSSGYYVITALSTPGASSSEAGVLWVVRGWIPAGPDARTPSSVPPVPEGPLVVEGRARGWEQQVDAAGLPPGQIQSIDPASLGSAGGLDSARYPFWLQASAEQPEPDEAPQRLPEPTVSEGPHLGYAIQWVFFAGGALIGGLVLVRRQREYYEEDMALAAHAGGTLTQDASKPEGN